MFLKCVFINFFRKTCGRLIQSSPQSASIYCINLLITLAMAVYTEMVIVQLRLLCKQFIPILILKGHLNTIIFQWIKMKNLSYIVILTKENTF